MSPELIGILGVGGGLAILMLGLFVWLRSDVGEIRRAVDSLRGRDVGDLRERMARVETLLGGRDGQRSREAIGRILERRRGRPVLSDEEIRSARRDGRVEAASISPVSRSVRP